MDEEKMIKKIPPHSEEMERCVLGSILIDGELASIAMDMLEPEDFYYKQNELVFYAMSRLYAEHTAIDTMTLKNKCEELGYGEDICSIAHLVQLVDIVPASGNIKKYCEAVKDKSTLRTLIKTSEEIANNAYLGKMETDDLFEKVERDVFKFLQGRRGTEDFVPVNDIVMEVYQNIEEAMLNAGQVTGVPSGFTDLDALLTGFHGTELILVAARPAMGKTAFVLNIAAYACFKKKIPIAMFSLEMGKEQLINRMLALESMVDSQKIRVGDLSQSDLDKITEAGDIIGSSPFFVDDTPGITVAEIRSKCRKIIQQEGSLGMIIIDYLQLMSGGRHIESRQQEVAEISRGLKGLAKELGVPVIALSQLNRAVDARDDHRPRMSDLRESGSIEQDADVVMFIYRDEYYNPDTTTKPGIAEIIVGKQRSGSTGSVDLVWLGQYTKFANKERARAKIQEPD